MKAQEQRSGSRLVEDPLGRGVRVYSGARTSPDPEALQQLLTVSRLPWVAEPVIALPDLHWKKRLEIPSSTAVATHSDIVLSFSSPSQNCGMNLLSTPLRKEDLSDRLLDSLMDRLREEIPRSRRRPTLDREEVIAYCRGGAPAVARRYDLNPVLCRTMEAGGNVLAREEPTLEELDSSMDRKSLEAGRYSFAFIGGGNHFLELQVVEDLLDVRCCRAMGLEKGQVVAMFHTGSERLGHDLGRLYSWRRKTDPRRRRKLFRRKVALHLMRNVRSLSDLHARWRYHFRRQDYVGVPAGSPDGQRLLLTLKVAANYGYANRMAVTALIQRAFRLATGSRSLDLGLVADLSHNTIREEKVGGRLLWIHRHNAARVIGPSGLPEDHPYREVGQPVMVPGTNRTSSYVLAGRDGAEGSLYSVDHGAGRTVERFEEAGLLRPMSGMATRKYTYQSSVPETLPHLSDEAIEEVMSVAEAAGLARRAARLRPVAVLKA